MNTKRDPQIAINEEVIIPLDQEAINPRDEGGNSYPVQNEPRLNRVPTQATRPSTGKTSKYPYQVSRQGERRI